MSEEEFIPNVPGEIARPSAEVLDNHQSNALSRAQFIGARLRTARIAAGMTQQELAGQRFSKSYISAIERGKMTPSFQALSFLADRLVVPVSSILGEGELDVGALAARRGRSPARTQDERVAHKKAALLHLSQAETLLRQDHPQAALECLGEGDEPSPDLPVPQQLIWYWLVGWATALAGKALDAIRFLEQGLHLAETLREGSYRTQQAPLAQMEERLRYFLGFAYCTSGQTKAALEQHLRGLTAVLAQTISDPELTVLIYKGLGNDYLILGRYQEAIRFYQEALKHLVDLDSVGQRGLIYWGLGLSYQEYGDWYRAKMAYQQTLQAVGSQENWSLVAQVRILLGEVLIKLEQYEEAEGQLHKGLEGARQLRNRRIEANALLDLAALALARGLPDEALQAATAGLEQVSQNPDPVTEGQLHLRLAEVHMAQQHSGAAEQAFQKALQVLQQAQIPDLLGQAYEGYGQFLIKEGRFQEAYEQMWLAHVTMSRKALGR